MYSLEQSLVFRCLGNKNSRFPHLRRRSWSLCRVIVFKSACEVDKEERIKVLENGESANILSAIR